MTRDDIIRMAKEAGYKPLVPRAFADDLQEIFIQKFAALVVAEKDREIERLREALKESVELIETLWPLEGATVRKARRALQEQPR